MTRRTTGAGRRRLARIPRAGQLRRFGAALVGPMRASALRAVVDGARVAWTLRRRGVRPLVAGLRPDRGVTDAERGRLVSEAVDAALAVLPLEPTCLRRSLTLARELDRLDLVGTLHLGVREVGGRIEAHAWVQVADEVVNDDPALISRYTRLASGDLERWAAAVR